MARARSRRPGKLRVIGRTEFLPEPIRARARRDLGFDIEFELSDGIDGLKRAVTRPDTFDVYHQWHTIDLIWTARAIQDIDLARIDGGAEIRAKALSGPGSRAIATVFGKLFLINFAMGVVTGIVQEFQFGMNWSNYSRFVGDIFGAPLALEGLLAFFLEATFIGLWIFGWDKLPRGIHLACIWIVAVGSILSAYFILAANAFMQNPVGYKLDPARGRAELTDLWAVLTNKVALAAFPHTIFGCFMVSAGLIIAVAAWHLSRTRNLETMRPALKFGLWMMVIAGIGSVISGDQLGLAMVQTQPMKMAAAEALYKTSTGADASFSIFTLGTPDGVHELFSIRVPYLLSFLSTHTLDGTVEGINDLNAHYQDIFGPGDYTPIIWVTY